jgi:hypothetical protein
MNGPRARHEECVKGFFSKFGGIKDVKVIFPSKLSNNSFFSTSPEFFDNSRWSIRFRVREVRQHRGVLSSKRFVWSNSRFVISLSDVPRRGNITVCMMVVQCVYN